MPQRHRRGRRLIGLTLVLALAGLLFATSARTARGTSLRTDRADSLAVLRAEQAKVDRAQARVDLLTQQVRDLTTKAGAGNSTVADLQRQVAALAGPAGFTAVRGPTLVVELDDAPPGRAAEGFRPDELVVHQQDVQAVVNALWAGGAEAMTLMGKRVGPTTAVRCVGNTVLVQDALYSPPYVVVAIGDPAALQRALDASPEIAIYRQFVSQAGLGWSAGPGGVRDLPAFTPEPKLGYAGRVQP